MTFEICGDDIDLGRIVGGCRLGLYVARCGEESRICMRLL